MDIDFDKSNGLLPAVIQDANTKVALMLGYMNQEAFEKTQKEGRVTFYSQSKKRLWTEGETSGNFLTVKEISVGSDGNALLIKAIPSSTNADTYWNETNSPSGNVQFLAELAEVIRHRRQHPKEGSYTNHLFGKGINKIAQKVGEEAVELVIEAKDDNRDLFLGEAADLLYHLLVLLEVKDIPLQEVVKTLEKRHRPQS